MSELDKTLDRIDALADGIGEMGRQIEEAASYTVVDQLKDIKDMNCNENCRWPLVYDDDDDALEAKCARCCMRFI